MPKEVQPSLGFNRSKLETHLITAIPCKRARRFVRPFLRLFLFSRWSALCIHWTFQGILNMDRTERLFKLGTDLCLALLFWVGFRLVMVEYAAVLLALVIAHTINLLFNGQILVLWLHYGVKKYDRQAVFRYIEGLRQRIGRESSILAVGIWGGIARGETEEDYPDVDLRFFRKPGIRNGLVACWIMVKERSRAFFSSFPLDAFLSDNWQHIARLRADETPVLLYDPSGFLQRRYTSAPVWRTLYPAAREGDA